MLTVYKVYFLNSFLVYLSYFEYILGARRGPATLVSGGDDSTVRLWDTRKRNNVALLQSKYQVCYTLIIKNANVMGYFFLC